MTAALTTCSKIRLSFKCVQLILACVCIGLFANIGIKQHAESTLMAITFGGFIIILSGVILGFCTGERCPRKVDLLFTLVGLALFVASGSVAISGFNKLKHHGHDIHPQSHGGNPHANAGHNEVAGNADVGSHDADGNFDHIGTELPDVADIGMDFPMTDVKLLKRAVNAGLAMGSIAIINGAFFLFDAVLSYKDVNEYTPHQ